MIYEKLCNEAKTNPRQATQLQALYETLDHFGVKEERVRKVVAETLLRFRIVKDCNQEYDPDDPLLMKLLAMDQFFSHQLRLPV